MHVHIDSAMARASNEALRPHAEDNPGHPDFALRAETWEGDVARMSLEEIFRFFNRVEFADGERLEEIGYDLPSLSVGDIVTIDGDEQWRVAPVGFERVDA